MQQNSRTLKLFESSNNFKTYIINLIEIIFQGFWLGVLNHDAFNNLTDYRYTYSKNSEKFKAKEYILSGLLEWEDKAVDLFFKNCKSILIAAAGGGREVIALSKRNIQVDAFDCNRSMVDNCRHFLNNQGINAKIVLSTADNVPKELGIYDGIIVGWNCYSHIIGRKARVRFLKQAREHIRPNGPILISFYPSPESRKRN